MLGSGVARYALPNWLRGIPVTDDQCVSAASRSRPWWRYSRARSGLDCEVATKPGAEQRDHCRIAVHELDRAVGLGALPGVQPDAGGEERVVAEDAHSLATRLVE